MSNYLNTIPTNIKLSKNHEVNEFMNSFLYHNESFFQKCINLGVKEITQSMVDEYSKSTPNSGIGIYYEKGPWKWGTQGMENQMVRRNHIKVLRSDRSTSCLNATPKLLNRILNNIYRDIENAVCVSEGRYDDRKFNPCR